MVSMMVEEEERLVGWWRERMNGGRAEDEGTAKINFGIAPSKFASLDLTTRNAETYFTFSGCTVSFATLGRHHGLFTNQGRLVAQLLLLFKACTVVCTTNIVIKDWSRNPSLFLSTELLAYFLQSPND